MKAISLFSGIGGLDLAAEWAGIETVLFCEKDPYCQKVLNKHWPYVPIVEDIRDVRGFPVDIVFGGYPCQPFSNAGKRRGTEDDRYLWPEMLRVIKECQPTWVVGENVAGHVSMGLDTVLLDMESAGYEVLPFVIPACAVNAPHIRKRTWVVAYAGSGWNGKQCKRIISEKNGIGKRDVHFWQQEPMPRRVADGIPRRVDRLRCLGNAVVPQQAYPLFAAITSLAARPMAQKDL